MFSCYPSCTLLFFPFSAYQIFFFHVFIFLKKKLSFFLGLIPLNVRLPDPTHTLNTLPSHRKGYTFSCGGFFWFGLVCLFDKCRLWLIKLDFVKTHKRCVCMICDITQPAKYRFFLSSFLSFSVKPGCHPQKFLFLFLFPFLGFIQGCLLCEGT